MPPELLAQFPIAEAAIEALGIVLWPMVEFEADDAIGAAAGRFGADPASSGSSICTPDKDMAQLVVDERVVSATDGAASPTTGRGRSRSGA